MKVHLFLFKTILPTFAITFLVLAIISPTGCKSSSEGLQILEGDFTVPTLEDVKIASDRQIQLYFSKEINLGSCTVCNSENSEKISSSISYTENNTCACVNLENPTEIGLSYILEGEVKDANENTLTFSIPFTGYNSRLPLIIFSEVLNAADSSTGHYEFVEFYVLKSGNTAGLEFISAGDGEAKKYTFPTIEVSEGEYIVLHLRVPTDSEGEFITDGRVNELEEDLTLSYALDSLNTARDLWVLNSSARISPSDVLLLQNSADSSVMDAVLFALSSATSWKTSYASYLTLVEESKKWKDSEGNFTSSIESACNCDSVTYKRSLSRQGVESLTTEDTTSSASDWIVTGVYNDRSGTYYSTPGYTNSTVEYVKPTS